MTKTKARVIQGWRQLSARPGFAKRAFAFRPARPPSGPAADAAPTPRSDTMGKNAEFVTNMDKMMTRWDKEVDTLARRAGNGALEAGEAYERGVKELRECRDVAQKAFQEIRFASESEGLQLKAGMQAAWVTMQSTLEKVTAGLVKK